VRFRLATAFCQVGRDAETLEVWIGGERGPPCQGYDDLTRSHRAGARDDIERAKEDGGEGEKW
jgi:hypothetical protein